MAITPSPSARVPTVSTLLGSDRARSVVLVASSTGRSRLTYSPFGHTGQTEMGILHYTGQPIETSTDLYILGNGYRMYSPTLCRFSGPDRLAPFDQGGLSTYAYTKQDPINSTDVSGLFGLKLFVRFLPKRSSTARPPVITGKLSYRTLPNGMHSTEDLRKRAAAMAERPGYLLEPLPPHLGTMEPRRLLPPLPSTGPRPGKLRHPTAINESRKYRPKHIYHLPEGSVRVVKDFYTKPTPRFATVAPFRAIREKINEIPALSE